MSEHQQQVIFFDWIRANPEIAPYFFHIKNEGHGNVITGRRMKRAGVLSGMPDIMGALAKKGYHGLFLEFKWHKNSVSPKQKQCITNLRTQGYKVEICYSAKEAADVVKDYCSELNLTDGFFD